MGYNSGMIRRRVPYAADNVRHGFYFDELAAPHGEKSLTMQRIKIPPASILAAHQPAEETRKRDTLQKDVKKITNGATICMKTKET